MSQVTHGVHRCPACEELADAEYGEGGLVTCMKCGHVAQRKVPAARRRPSYALEETGGSLVQRDVASRRKGQDLALPLSPKTVLPKTVIPETQVSPEDDELGRDYDRREEVVSEDGDKKVVRRRKRKRKLRMRRVVFVVLWFLSVALILIFVRTQMEGGLVTLVSETVPEVADDGEVEAQRRGEAEAYVTKSMPECRQTFAGFLDAPDAAKRAQYVFRGAEIAPLMTTFYNQNTPFRMDSGWGPREGNLVLHGKLRAIETVWASETNETAEVVFVREKGVWKVDWEFFVRHSSVRWQEFSAEDGPTEGTFRLFARLRDATFSEDGDKLLNLRFYPPTDQQLLRSRGSSPAVLVPLNGESGRRIQEIVAYKDRETLAGKRSIYENDPSNLHRMRVVLEWREGTDGARYLHLKEVLAGNWLATGFEEAFGRPQAGEGVPEEAGAE